MSDHSSPVFFAEVFRLLASDPTEQHVKWAKKLWKLSFEFDFNACDLDEDKALKKLGLAKDGKDEYGDDLTIYREANGRTWERFNE